MARPLRPASWRDWLGLAIALTAFATFLDTPARWTTWP
jgi:hypothetical protein